MINTSNKSIQIAGGGIAGLTVALQLKQSGFNPIVYEKETEVGGGRDGDYEGLENWIFSKPVPDFFNDFGINFNRLTTFPINQFVVHSQNSKPFTIYNKHPFFYMVSRGKKSNDLDFQLFQQCKTHGVQFEFGKKAPDSCQIIATGTTRAAAFIQGTNFETVLPNQVHLLLGKRFAPKGYAYLIILNGRGTLATAFKKSNNLKSDSFKNSMNYFNSMGLKIPPGKPFGGRGSFSLPIGSMQPPYKIGEAGGFQDYLFGFGIRMSMMSGQAAGLSIMGKKRESKKIIKALNQKRRLSFLNRIIYEQLSDERMVGFVKKLSEKTNPLSILGDAYSWNFKNILRWINLGQQYEVRPT
ncbi:MAG: NAD(P)-binding protein [Candidatus Marinimicrobia bacterium]|nr:NAD(P)-binding protein [Candidatus Neomarinimicrobiota bacterium]